jgi:hypothetical protein
MNLYETDPAYPTMSAQARALLPTTTQFSIGHCLEKENPCNKESPAEKRLEIHLHVRDGNRALFSIFVPEPLSASLWNAGGAQTVDASFIRKMIKRHLAIGVSVDESGERLEFEMLWFGKVPLGIFPMHLDYLMPQAMSA